MNEHFLIVTLEPLTAAEQYEYGTADAAGRAEIDRERRRITTVCDDGSPSCQSWIECMQAHQFSADEEDMGEGEAHGEFHLRMNGMWCVETGKCSLDLSNVEAWEDSARDLADRLGPGEWPVTFTWDDEYTILIERARELADARA